MSLIKRILLFLAIPVMISLSGCSAQQDGKLVGTWVVTPMNALPEAYPRTYWEFTADQDLLKYDVDELGSYLIGTGRWGFTKKNRLNISKFEVSMNGEWEIVTFKDDVLRMILKEYTPEGNPSGQVLVEFTRVRTL